MPLLLALGYASSPQAAPDIGSTVGAGLEVAAIGMGVVFAVLILLYGLMVLIGRFGYQPSPGSGVTAAPVLEPAAEPLAAEGSPVGQLAEGDEDEQRTRHAHVVAAVAAALVAAMETEASAAGQPPAVPDRLKRTKGWRSQMSWELAGRMELVTARARLPRG